MGPHHSTHNPEHTYGNDKKANLLYAREFANRQEFIRARFAQKVYCCHLINMLNKENIIHWAIMIGCSSRFRQFLRIFTEETPFNDQELAVLENMFIIQPITNLFWRDKVVEVINSFEATDQVGKTCWSYAIASAIYLSSKRIVGRSVPGVLTIRDRLVDQFGACGQCTEEVMKIVLPDYGLHYKQVEEDQLRQIAEGCRVCVATFSLDGAGWYNFSEFFCKNPKGTITQSVLQKYVPEEKLTNKKLRGHAVLLIDIEGDSLVFMNSWGESFADKGKFRIQRGAIPIEFFDVFWYESELTNYERKTWKRKCSEAKYNIGQILRMVDQKQLQYNTLLSEIAQKGGGQYNQLIVAGSTALKSNNDQESLLFNIIQILRMDVEPFKKNDDYKEILDYIPEIVAILEREGDSDNMILYQNFLSTSITIPEIKKELQSLCAKFWSDN